MTAIIQTLDTPDGPFTLLAEDGRVLASGWTADGGLIRVEDGRVVVCYDEECTTTPVELGEGDVRVGGSIYES